MNSTSINLFIFYNRSSSRHKIHCVVIQLHGSRSLDVYTFITINIFPYLSIFLRSASQIITTTRGLCQMETQESSIHPIKIVFILNRIRLAVRLLNSWVFLPTTFLANDTYGSISHLDKPILFQMTYFWGNILGAYIVFQKTLTLKF